MTLRLRILVLMPSVPRSTALKISVSALIITTPRSVPLAMPSSLSSTTAPSLMKLRSNTPLATRGVAPRVPLSLSTSSRGLCSCLYQTNLSSIPSGIFPTTSTKSTKRSKRFKHPKSGEHILISHRILDSVSDAEGLAKMAVNKFTDLFVKA